MSYSLNSGSINQPNGQWLRTIHHVGAKRSNASLDALLGQIHQWNINRISANHLLGLSQHLSAENVEYLKAIIRTSMNKIVINQPEIVADQLLFLTIGAIQIESQNGSNKAWQLVDRAIQNIVAPKKEMPKLILSFFGMLLALSSYLAINIDNKSHISAPATPFVLEVESSPDPVTISMLALTYRKMKAGTCQMPQAAMLAPEQRNAFLMFVNGGTIDVHHVEDLRLALGYVNCLYPQQLMHPMLPRAIKETS